MPDPLVLGFDTSAAHCAAVLLRGDRVLAERHEEMGKGQAERLMPMLDDVLAIWSLRWSSRIIELALADGFNLCPDISVCVTSL